MLKRSQPLQNYTIDPSSIKFLRSMQPFSPHDRFFSSLSQVEKRLASEKEPSNLSSPLYLSYRHPPLQESSGPPLDFLSNSHSTPEEQEEGQQREDPSSPIDDIDDIERLVDLLGLSLPLGDNYCSSCDCSSGGGFYSKVVGVKGPRCGKEMERLNGWIELYSAEKREPARLAHLLLGKAVSLGGGGDDDGFGEIGFPSTVGEFLEHDPPPPPEEEEGK